MSSLDDANEEARVKALLINAWPDGRHRYHHDPLFHWAIHHAARMAIAGHVDDHEALKDLVEKP